MQPCLPIALNKRILISLFLILVSGSIFGQHSVRVNAVLNDSLRSFYVQQEIVYHNNSPDTLSGIYLNDWINAFDHKRTPLARRFFEDHDRDFHFSGEEKRGRTTINSISNAHFEPLLWERPQTAPDLIFVKADSVIAPGEQFIVKLNYSVRIPSDSFTRFGYSRLGDYKLRYWFLTPGVYDNGWEVYSHKNLNDLYLPKLDIDINLRIPTYFAAISPLRTESITTEAEDKIVRFTGTERLDPEIFLTRTYVFEEYETPHFHVMTNMDDDGLSPVMKSHLLRQISEFVYKHLGKYPHQHMLSTQEEYSANPIYGLNQLPKFVRPFPEGFNYELKQLKTLTGNYLRNTLLLNPRHEKWIIDAIQTYLMMEYLDQHYPDMKILGSLSEVIGVRWSHLSDLEFNDQYPLLYMHMARRDLDQALSTPQDSLVMFNKNIANAYKAGVGLKYLDAFLQDTSVSVSIKEFYNTYRLKEVEESDFRRILEKNASKDISWFFDDYVNTNKKIDFKIRNIEKQGDSLEVTIRNKTSANVPVPIYGLKNEGVVHKEWVENIGKLKTVRIPAKGVDRVALNYEGSVPEVNQRDNYMALNNILNKPFQFRLLKDIEDPRYTQLFLMPEVQYNLYDGLSIGPKIYNTTLMSRNFEFQVTPLYGLGSQTMVGGASFSHVIRFHDQELYAIQYGASANRFSYGYNLFYERLTPFLSLNFRSSDLRNGVQERISLRNVNVYRDQNPARPLEVPEYSVFNMNYSYRQPGMIENYTGNIDFQLAEKFSKSSVTFEYRKLLKNNRQIKVRFFGGAFLYNDLTSSDYFSFALDRPTDYLFDYNYYGRSETSGIFSQQIIMAEGGFKSRLEPQFANQWITTVNGSTTIWKWVYAYGDVGLVKNKYKSAKFLYDSGIRLSLIENYFEIFLPVYSSEGWEFNQGDYDQRIRFIATLDIPTIIKLFTREWF